MKTSFLFLCAAALAIGQSSAVDGTNTTAQNPLTFEECVREAAENNPELYAAREGVNAARANLLGSYSPFLPQLSASGSARRNNQELDTGYQATTSYRAGISASQNIFNGLQDIARLRQSRARFNQTEINLQRIKANLSADIRDTFAALLFAQDALVLYEKIAERRKENLSLIEMRFKAGTEDRGSLLRSQAFYNQALLDVLEAKRQINVARRKLNKALGRQDNAKIAVTGDWQRVAPPTPPDFEEMVKMTPEYRNADIQCVIAREAIRVARAEFLPTWSVSADYGLSDDESIIPHDESYSFGTSIGLNIFNGGLSIFSLRAARAEERATQAQLRSATHSILAALEERFTGWQNAVERARLQDELLSAAQTRMEIAQIKYSNGMMTFQDWDTIGNDLIANQKSMLEREFGAVSAQAAWEKAVGFSVLPGAEHTGKAGK